MSQKGRGDEAVAVLRRLIAAQPAYGPGRLNLGTALMQQGQLAEAAAELRALQALEPANAEAAYNLGLALKQQDDFAGAETELRKAARLDPTLPEAPFTLGVVLWQTGRPDEALEQFRETLARKADYADAFYMIGTIYKQQGALAEAMVQFKEAIKHRPLSAEAHLSLGQALNQLGDKEAGASRAGGSRPPQSQNGRRAGIDVRGQRRSAEGQSRRLSRRDRTVPRGHPPGGRQPAGALPARARAAAHRRTSRGADPLRDGAPPRPLSESAGQRQAMTLAPRTQSWRRSRMRDVLVLLAGLVTVAAGATERQPRPAAPVFSFANTAREAGLTAITVYGGKDTNKYLLETTGSGVAVFDYDNDGWLDLFIVNGSDARRISAGSGADGASVSQSTRRHVRGRHREVRASSQSGWGQGACVGDYDNDGHDDLFVTYWGQNRLYRNRGDGTFDDVTVGAGLADEEAALGHRLRLPRLRPRRPPRSVRRQLHRFRSRHRARCRNPACAATKGCRSRAARPDCTGGKNVLYHNAGDGTFEDVSERSGITRASGTYGLGVSTLDFDNDGWVDLYVANDSNPSALYRNNHDGTFKDIGVEAGCAYSQDGKPQAGHGRRRRRLRPQRHDGHLQDQLRRRHLDALRERRQGLLRGPDVRRPASGSTPAGSDGASASSISTTTAGSTSSSSTATSIPRSSSSRPRPATSSARSSTATSGTAASRT